MEETKRKTFDVAQRPGLFPLEKHILIEISFAYRSFPIFCWDFSLEALRGGELQILSGRANEVIARTTGIEHSESTR